jgi:hypothetical protein
MTDKTFDPKLWTERSPDETRALYTDWAATYDADVTGAGYATPKRLAEALAAHVPDPTAPLLDFGCGTGLSGRALHAAGFTTLDGTDITPGDAGQGRRARPLPQALALRAGRRPAPGLRHHRRHRRRQPRRGPGRHARTLSTRSPPAGIWASATTTPRWPMPPTWRRSRPADPRRAAPERLWPAPAGQGHGLDRLRPAQTLAPMITRFAPSPTGPLHLGHAFSAILAHDMARAAGGTFLLRIEDIDRSAPAPNGRR